MSDGGKHKREHACPCIRVRCFSSKLSRWNEINIIFDNYAVILLIKMLRDVASSIFNGFQSS